MPYTAFDRYHEGNLPEIEIDESNIASSPEFPQGSEEEESAAAQNAQARVNRECDEHHKSWAEWVDGLPHTD